MKNVLSKGCLSGVLAANILFWSAQVSVAANAAPSSDPEEVHKQMQQATAERDQSKEDLEKKIQQLEEYEKQLEILESKVQKLESGAQRP